MLGSTLLTFTLLALRVSAVPSPKDSNVKMGLHGIEHDTSVIISTLTDSGEKVTFEVDIDLDDGASLSSTSGTSSGTSSSSSSISSTSSSAGTNVGNTPASNGVSYSTSNSGVGSGSNSGVVYNTYTTNNVVNNYNNYYDFGNSTGAIPAGAYTSLIPAPIPGLNLHSTDNLAANSTAQIFYQHDQSDPTAPVSYALLTIPNALYPIVNLDHSALISSISCNSTACTIKLTSHDALVAFTANWNGKSGSVLLIASGVTFTDGATSSNSTTDHLASDADLTVVAQFTSLTFVDVVNPSANMTLDLGHGYLNQTGSQAAQSGSGAVFNSFNSTSTNSTTPSNGTVSSAIVNGNSTGCGSDVDFDICLDNKIGYMDADHMNLAQLFPGVDSQTLSGLSRRDLTLDRRGLFSKIGNFITSKIIQPVYQEAKKVLPAAVSKTLDTIVDKSTQFLRDTLGAAYDTVSKYTSAEWHPFQTTLSLNMAPQYGLVDLTPVRGSKWGVSNLLFNRKGDKGEISIYCVRCGASGQLAFDSKIVFSLVGGLTAGQFSANGDAHAAFGLGIIASYSDKYTPDPTKIFSVPLAPLSVKGIINVGPQLVFSVGHSYSINANGYMMGRIALDWDKISNTIDLVGSNTGFTGWTPRVTYDHDAGGQIDLSASISAIVAIEVSVDILNGKFTRGVSIREVPSATLEAASAFGSTAPTGNAALCPTGVEVTLSLKNSVQYGLKLTSGPETDKDMGDPYVLDKAYQKCVDLGLYVSLLLLLGVGRLTFVDSKQTSSQVTTTTNTNTNTNSSTTTTTSTNNNSTTVDLTSNNSTTSANNGTSSTDLSSNTTVTGNSTTSGNDTSVNLPAPTYNNATLQDEYSYTNKDNSTADDTTYDGRISIGSMDGSLEIKWNNNGNLYVIPATNEELDTSNFFLVEDEVIYGDTFNDTNPRYLHAYTDTLQSLGVSRLRLAPVDQMPLTSVYVTFNRYQVTDASNQPVDVLLATTTSTDPEVYYYPVVCVYGDKQYSKLFLATDPDAGVKVLQDVQYQATITGGLVSSCAYLPLVEAEGATYRR
ncbi:hypothetical protein VNI00_005171 [Paramarasmius palmivorus]|uniref:DUF7223 domain-containing protein n=1 Tax=Paramarasmius palmivorus TaxID=297713 RepID=A0AAW0DHS4_9AGAR